MSMGDQGYTIPLDGSRYLMQPPFTPAGIIITNRTDRAVTVQDGRAWSRSVRPGAVGRFSIDRPDSNYIGQLASAGTEGECRVTFSATAIVETGEPATEGPRLVMDLTTILDAGNVEELIDCSVGRIAYLSVVPITVPCGLAVNEEITWPDVTLSMSLTGGVELTMTTVTEQQIRLGEGEALPLPELLVLHRNSGSMRIRIRVRT